MIPKKILPPKEGFARGQVCCSVERIYVDAAVKEEFEKKCVALARDWVATGPLQKRLISR